MAWRHLASDRATLPDDQRNARLYLGGLAVSLVGDSAMILVAGIWVKSLTGSSALAGLVSVCIYAPAIAGPVAGLVVDRLPRRRLLLRVNVASALVVGTLIAVEDRGQLWLIYAVMTAYGVSLVTIGAAEDALFVEMFPDDLRQRVNGWRLALQETGRLVAPLVGAGLFVLVGGNLVAAVDAATFLVAALVLSRLHVSDAAPESERSHWRRDVAAGLTHVGRTRELRRLLLAATGIMAISGFGVAAQYSLVTAVGRPPSFLGVFAAALGAGSILASVTSGRLIGRFGERALAIAGLVNYTLGAVLYATGVLALALAGAVVFGFALPWVFLAVLNAAQRLTPAGLQGRVSATVTLALFGPQAPMQALGSYAISTLTYREIYLTTAATAVVLAAALSYPSSRGSE